MGSFYENYLRLCNEVKKSPSGVALEIGLSKTAVNGWKHGRTNPTDATAQRIAEYFGITVAELMAENENKPTENSELTETQREAIELVMKMSDEQLKVFVATLKAAMGE